MNNSQPIIDVSRQSSAHSTATQKIIKWLIVMSVLAIVIVSASFLTIRRTLPIPTGLIESPSTDNGVYSVKDVESLFQTHPNDLKNKSIQLKAYVVDSVRGTGCNDYLVLTDYEHVANFRNRYDNKLTPAQRKEAQDLVMQAPVIYTGMTLNMPGEIFPTQGGIYEGQFYDLEMQRQCDVGEKRFVIDKKVQELSEVNSQDIFKTLANNTLYVSGEIVEHKQYGATDLPLRLIVNTAGQKVALVYNEGDVECLNTQAASWVQWGKNVNRGTRVQAYGAYVQQRDGTYELTFCSSKEYFILGADDSAPAGMYTDEEKM